MHLSNQIMADTTEFVDFIQNYPSGTPVCMLNILKFKDQTEESDTGEERYAIYSDFVAPLLKKVGGRLLWAGNVTRTVIGDYTTQPDRILLVEYPSKEAFIEMTTSEDYKKIGGNRTISLEYGGLLATQTIFSKL